MGFLSPKFVPPNIPHEGQINGTHNFRVLQFLYGIRALGCSGGKNMRRRRVFVSLRRRQVSAAAAGFWAAATTKDHMDVDHGDDFVGDVELNEDLDVVVQVDVDVRLSVDWLDAVQMDRCWCMMFSSM